MSYKLVIAEKPLVAQSIAKVIGADKREDGYLPLYITKRSEAVLQWGKRKNFIVNCKCIAFNV